MQALRTQITWDETLFTFVGGSVRAAQGSLTVVQQAREGRLSVDLAFLGPSLSGDAELFSFELSPIEPNTLTLEARTEYRSREGEHGFSSTQDSAEATDSGDGLDDDGQTDETDDGGLNDDSDGDGIPDSQEETDDPGDDDGI